MIRSILAESLNMKGLATPVTLRLSVLAFADSGSKPEPNRISITCAILISPENLGYLICEKNLSEMKDAST